MNSTTTSDLIIIGAGFSGLATAYDLCKQGKKVVLFEADDQVGGLAGSFMVGNQKLEKFYHHWFTNDEHILNIIKELGLGDNIVFRPTRTGMYYAKNFFRLSSPLDLLKFTPLSFFDRIKLGRLILSARKVDDWKQLEDITAEEWLSKSGGKVAYDRIWKPMLVGKFGPYAQEISAVFMWNKLKLRGGSRGKGGEEQLAYYQGGFASLADSLAEAIRKMGGEIHLNTPVEKVIVENGKAVGVMAGGSEHRAKAVLGTTAIPAFTKVAKEVLPQQYVADLDRIKYLANVCLVLELNKSLSGLYWINVADPNFPFVGIIEHTNFEPVESYEGKHIVYLSKYLPESAELFQMKDDEVLQYAIPHIKTMFPDFDPKTILGHHVWRATCSQPIITKHYSKLIPAFETPVDGLYLTTMAQIYPEDRGTNYAIREGRKTAKKLQELGVLN